MDRISAYAYCGFDLPAEERFQKIKEAGFQKVAVWCHTDFNTYIGISEYEQFKFVREQGLEVSYAHAPIKFAPYLMNKYYGAKEAIKTYKIYLKGAKACRQEKQGKCRLITSDVLGKVFEPNQRFEAPDGSDIIFDTDYYGDSRTGPVIPGPFAYLHTDDTTSNI